MGRLCAVALLCLVVASVSCQPTVVVVVPTPELTETPLPTPSPTPATVTPVPIAAPTPTPRPTPTPSLSDLVERLKPSVVQVLTDKGGGSGAIYSVEGQTAYIVTNEHVIAGGRYVDIWVGDADPYRATVLGQDVGHDLAVLSICCGSFQAVPFADSADITTGMEVMVIGYPGGAVRGEATVTRGIISAVGPHEYYSYGDSVQTDAAINPGNSGGPVFSLSGEVVSIATFKEFVHLDGRQAEALGFAIPANTVVSQLPALRAGASVHRKPTLIFSNLNWPSAHIQNYIARTILEWGYGYETDAVLGDTVPLAEALVRGDTNVTMEIWLPNQQEFLDAAVVSGTVTSIGKSLEDNWQSAFIIPQYVADAYPGLRTPHDLKNPLYRNLFVTPDSNGKARLLNCIPGWECEQVNKRKVAVYGLQDVVELVNPGSDWNLARQIRTSFERREPVLFYYWGPTVLSYDLETTYGGFKILEEPAYSKTCWVTTYACQYPTAEVHIVVRTELLQSAPDAVEFLKKWDFNAGNQLAAEGYMNVSGADFSEVATWFLRNTTEWQGWVTPEAREKVLAVLG